MIKWILLILFASQNIWAGNSLKEISLRCGPLSAGEKPLYASDFRWDYDIPSMLLKFTESLLLIELALPEMVRTACKIHSHRRIPGIRHPGKAYESGYLNSVRIQIFG